MLKFITIAVVALIACAAAAPGLASLGHGPILGGYGSPYGSPYGLSAPAISYASPIAKIAAPISYAPAITKIAAPSYAPLGLGLGHGGLIGAPLGLSAHGLGLSAHGLGLGLGGHGPIW
ncbi:glycine-rich protein-like [Eupeodes corollae]|uniref:glycine-rich protein-like n=1 Tax=Eupeodes corollae TaxID=290404 RepID=UPI0024922847|nr:glycine-rich protein-like [Eupeodes corollae]